MLVFLSLHQGAGHPECHVIFGGSEVMGGFRRRLSQLFPGPAPSQIPAPGCTNAGRRLGLSASLWNGDFKGLR